MVSRGGEDVPLIMAVENGGDSEAMTRGGLLVQIMDLRALRVFIKVQSWGCNNLLGASALPSKWSEVAWLNDFGSSEDAFCLLKSFLKTA